MTVNRCINRRQIGDKFEAHAQTFLEAQGFELVQQQFDIRIGEIDLIMRHPQKNILIFVEVRARRSNNFGGALLSVSPQKCRKIIQAADSFLQEYPQFLNDTCRFDIITFEAGRLAWHEGAFEAASL